MNENRRSVLRYALVLSAAACCPAMAAQERAALGIAAALNLAGRQRMLAQRAAKAWIMRGLELLPAQTNAILAESLAMQKRQLAELDGFQPSDGVRAARKSFEQIWEKYRAALAQPALLGNAQAVYDLSEEAQERAHRLTLAYEMAASAPQRYRLINVAGRQRMLSQRAAKFYLLGVWGVNVQAARLEMNFSRAEFSSGMHQLAAAANADASIRATVEALDRAWVTYRELFVAGRHGEFSRDAAKAVATGSEEILAVTDRLVAQLARSLEASASK